MYGSCNIQQGLVKLPRFQRYEAWDKWRITSFLNTIISNLPVGVTLALEVAGEEKFISRYIVSAEPAVEGTVTQHLLDGQQRLTAFWRGMHNNYEFADYFIYLPKFDAREYMQSDEMQVYCQGRWTNRKWLARAGLGRCSFPSAWSAVYFRWICFALVISRLWSMNG